MTLSLGRCDVVQNVRCGFKPTTTTTSRRGCGGGGSGARAGSGEGVRERENAEVRLGRLGIFREESEWDADAAGGDAACSVGGGGAFAKEMTKADSASRVSPSL